MCVSGKCGLPMYVMHIRGRHCGCTGCCLCIMYATYHVAGTMCFATSLPASKVDGANEPGGEQGVGRGGGLYLQVEPMV